MVSKHILEAKQKSIVDVALALGLELTRAGKNYHVKGYPTLMISPERNYWTWWNRGDEYRGQDVIKLVEVINNVPFKEALKFVRGLNAQTFDSKNIPEKKPFVYRMKEVKKFDYARKYLKENRMLSDGTIDFFYQKGIMQQAIYENYEFKTTEPCIVFKSYDFNHNVVGASVQGIWFNQQMYKKKGRVKHILKDSDGLAGVTIDIGNPKKFNESTPDKPFKVYAFEAVLDMMSYYELNQDVLDNCRLVAMNGLSKGTISRATVEALVSSQAELSQIEKQVKKEQWIDKFDKLGLKNLEIHVCVDNDEIRVNEDTGRVTQAGIDFLNSLNLKNIPVINEIPPLHEGQVKNDWNDELKYRKKKDHENLKDNGRNLDSVREIKSSNYGIDL